MSFVNCGHRGNLITLKTDRMKDPKTLGNVVETISKIGLKDSLKEVDIYFNEIIKIDEVQVIFYNLGMSHISAVSEVLFLME